MQTKKKRQSGVVRRLLIANLLALFALGFLVVVALFATGLLGSVLAFVF